MVRWLAMLAVGFFSATAWGEPTAYEKLKAMQSDPAALRAAIDSGKKFTFFCANCHGETGISKMSDVPNLAGQNSAYLLEQIRKFGSGERKDQFMQGLIKVLKEEERMQAAVFYAGTPVPPNRSDAAAAARGRDLYAKLCVRCHGTHARGDEQIPRLAGQQMPYLQKSISRYRNQSGERTNQLMAIATSPLKDEDIVSIANYLTQLP